MAKGIFIRPARLDEVDQILAVWGEADATPSITEDRDGCGGSSKRPTRWSWSPQADGRFADTVIGAWDG